MQRAVLALFLLGACSTENTLVLGLDAEPVEILAACMEVEPDILQFGPVEVGRAAPLGEVVSITQDTFALESEPVPETLVVEVDGITSEEWVWGPATELVVFDTRYLPPGGSTVEFTYRPAADCDG